MTNRAPPSGSPQSIPLLLHQPCASMRRYRCARKHDRPASTGADRKPAKKPLSNYFVVRRHVPRRAALVSILARLCLPVDTNSVRQYGCISSGTNARSVAFMTPVSIFSCVRRATRGTSAMRMLFLRHLRAAGAEKLVGRRTRGARECRLAARLALVHQPAVFSADALSQCGHCPAAGAHEATDNEVFRFLESVEIFHAHDES